MHYPRWTKRSRRVPQGSLRQIGRWSRALRAEVLEGRMMLSVASPAIVSTWEPFEFASVTGQQIGILSHRVPIVAILPQEGGFVLSGSMTMDRDATVPQAWHYNSDTTIDVLLAEGSIFSPKDADVEWSNYDTFGSGGFIGRAINSGSYVPDVLPLGKPESPENAAAAAPQEGGLISVNPVTTPPRLGSESKPAESALVGSSSILRSKPSSLADSSDANSTVREISGEWARAVVFEVAGGEPIADRPQVESPPADAIASNRFTSSGSDDASKSFDKPGIDARQTPVDAPATSSERMSADLGDAASIAPALEVPAPGFSGDPLTSLGVATSSSEIPPIAGAFAKSADEQQDEVLASAFEQFGEGELALASSSSDRPRLHGWLSGTPLLLMFALERITARSSRRQAANSRWA